MKSLNKKSLPISKTGLFSVEANDEFHWKADLEMNVLEVSPNAQKILNNNVNKFLGPQLISNLDEFQSKNFNNKISNIKKKQIENFQIELKMPWGPEVPHSFLFSVTGDYDYSGQLAGFQGLVRDISLNKEINNSLTASRISSIVEMSRGLAHEINNPLTILSGKVAKLKMFLEKGVNDIPTLEKEYDTMEKYIDKIGDIITHLRDFSRDASKDPFEIYDLGIVFSNVKNYCFERLKAKDIDLILVPLKEKVSILGRKTQLAQILINLINNSQDALLQNSVENKWIEINTIVEKEYLIIHVTDSGAGIPKEIGEKIFDPFFTTKDIGEATGLGLSTSFGIIKDHGGEFYLDENSPNTRFVIKLPRNNSSEK